MLEITLTAILLSLWSGYTLALQRENKWLKRQVERSEIEACREYLEGLYQMEEVKR